MSNYTDHSIASILDDDNSYDSTDAIRQSGSGRYAQYYEFHGDNEYENGKAMEGMNSFMVRFIDENMDIIEGLCLRTSNWGK